MPYKTLAILVPLFIILIAMAVSYANFIGYSRGFKDAIDGCVQVYTK